MTVPGWQDVLALQQQTREEVLGAISVHREESRQEHAGIDRRLDALEDAKLIELTERATRKQILGLGRAGVASLIALATAVAALLRPA